MIMLDFYILSAAVVKAIKDGKIFASVYIFVGAECDSSCVSRKLGCWGAGPVYCQKCKLLCEIH